jgi:GNAT superfamily N-acetyltransferase
MNAHHRSIASASLSSQFTPIGHISIDAYSPIPGLTDPLTHRYAISTFYISRAIHGIGLGGLAMRAAEKMAVEVLGAKCLSLNTVEKGAQRRILEERGLPVPEVS